MQAAMHGESEARRREKDRPAILSVRCICRVRSASLAPEALKQSLNPR